MGAAMSTQRIVLGAGRMSRGWAPVVASMSLLTTQQRPLMLEPYEFPEHARSLERAEQAAYLQFNKTSGEQKVLLEPPEMQTHQLSATSKRNIVLVGLTGVGKSTTANRLTSSSVFEASDSLVSVTSQVQYKDVHQSRWWRNPPADYRVIDTPGFFDTTMTEEQVADALKEFAGLAREGLAAVVIVVRQGRFTQENQAVLKFVELVLGREALAKFGILVVTDTGKSGKELKSEFDSLPNTNLGRQLANTVNGRIVPIGKSSNADALFDNVEELFKGNGYSALDCDMMNFDRLTLQKQREWEEATQMLRDGHRQSEEEKDKLRKQLRVLEGKVAELQIRYDARVNQIVRESRGLSMSDLIGTALHAAVSSAAHYACNIM